MAYAGGVVESPSLRLAPLKTAADGTFLRFEQLVRAGNPEVQERFVAFSGGMVVRAAGVERVFEEVVVPADTAHTFWSAASTEEPHQIKEPRSAPKHETLLGTVYGDGPLLVADERNLRGGEGA